MSGWQRKHSAETLRIINQARCLASVWFDVCCFRLSLGPLVPKVEAGFVMCLLCGGLLIGKWMGQQSLRSVEQLFCVINFSADGLWFVRHEKYHEVEQDPEMIGININYHMSFCCFIFCLSCLWNLTHLVIHMLKHTTEHFKPFTGIIASPLLNSSNTNV